MIRESSVVSGTEFLSHPTVIPHSREEKVSFLRGKGLTTDEIEEAFKRVEGLQRPAGSGAGAAGPQQGLVQPQAQALGHPAAQYSIMQPMPIQPQEAEAPWSFFSNLVVPASLALSAGASALYFYKTYITHENASTFPWETQAGGGLQPPPLFQDPICGGRGQAGIMCTHRPGGSNAMSRLTNSDKRIPGGASNAAAITNGTQPQQQQAITPLQQQLPGLVPQQQQPSWSPFVPPGASQQSQQPPNGSSSANGSQSNATSVETTQLWKSIEDQNTSIRDMVSSLKDVLTMLKETKPASSSSSSTDANIQMMLQAVQSSSDVKAELSAIKTLLLANLVKSNNVSSLSPNTTSNTSSGEATTATADPNLEALLQAVSSSSPTKSQAVTNEPEVEKTEEQKKEEAEDAKRKEGMNRARQALASLVQQCPSDQPDQLVQGCNMMLMFLKNIVKDPLNPRFRRVARSNANFKKSVEPLAGHIQFFQSVGFEERGSQLELKNEWTEDLGTAAENGWAKAIIDDAISNLESVKEQYTDASPATSSTGTPIPSSNSKAVAASASSPAIKSTTPPAKWQVPKAGTIAYSPPVVDPIQNPVPPPPPKQPVQQQQPVEDAPSYPLSFAEVARMHAEGKRPDGIKDIPDRLSSDEPSKPSMTAPRKPWEVESNVTTTPAWTAPRIGSAPRPKVEIVELNDDEETSNGTEDGETE